jgi:hypothetical protein
MDLGSGATRTGASRSPAREGQLARHYAKLMREQTLTKDPAGGIGRVVQAKTYGHIVAGKQTLATSTERPPLGGRRFSRGS